MSHPAKAVLKGKPKAGKPTGGGSTKTDMLAQNDGLHPLVQTSLQEACGCASHVLNSLVSTGRGRPGPEIEQAADEQKRQGGIAQGPQQRVGLLRRVDLDLDPERPDHFLGCFSEI